MTGRQPNKLEALIRIDTSIRVIGALVGPPFRGARRSQVQFGDLRSRQIQNCIRSADQAPIGMTTHSRKKTTSAYLFIDVPFVLTFGRNCRQRAI